MNLDLVIPTIGRPSLVALLRDLAANRGPAFERILLVDDRRSPDGPLIASGTFAPAFERTLRVGRGGGRGPANARNVGWRAARSAWVAFLDDDVRVGPDWSERLARDLAGIDAADPNGRIAGSYGKIVVTLPAGRRATDWERNVASLQHARHITADAAFRREALAAVGGFDARFPRAFREDSDLAMRLERAGYGLRDGERETTHPVRPAGRWVSVALQRGNADDALMEALHGAAWLERRAAEPSAYHAHRRTVAAALDAAAALVTGRPRAAAWFAFEWLRATAAFAVKRIAPGPRTRHEIVTMLVTSVAIPFAAVAHRLRGERIAARSAAPRVRAVLFDRDGTLVADAPIAGDPSRVVPLDGAAASLERLRDAHLRIGVVTNQPGLARGAFTVANDAEVRARIESLLGPIGTWAVCDHAEDAGCDCRKPRPALVERAARALGVTPQECVVVGDIGSDVDAALAAGARSILVPTAVTRDAEIARAPHVAANLSRAVDLVLSGSV